MSVPRHSSSDVDARERTLGKQSQSFEHPRWVDGVELFQVFRHSLGERDYFPIRQRAAARVSNPLNKRDRHGPRVAGEIFGHSLRM